MGWGGYLLGAAIWNARKTNQVAHSAAAQQGQQQYENDWKRGQAELVARVRRQELTVEAAEANLAANPQWRSTSPGHYDGQRDLCQALRDGRVTLRAAAITLGVIAPDE